MPVTEVVSGPDVDRLAKEPPSLCLNCGADLPGAFCPDCGQRDQPLQQPAGVFIREAISEYFGIDGRLWRSIGLLLFRPGALTVAYLEGRRQQYLRPLRLYLTATLAFFFTVSVLSAPGITAGSDRYGGLPADTLLQARFLEAHLEAGAEATTVQRDILRTTAAGLMRGDGATQAAAVAIRTEADSLDVLAGLLSREAERVDDFPSDSLVTPALLDPRAVAVVADSIATVTAGPQVGDGLTDFMDRLPRWAKGGLARRFERAESGEERQLLIEQYRSAIVGQIPTALFLVLPLFALLLKLVYARGGGRRPRVGPPPQAPEARTPGGLRARYEVQRLRYGWDRWRQHRAIRRRRAKAARTRRRLVRGALRRGVAAVREHPVLQPWRRYRLAVLRRSLRSRRTRFYAEHLVFALHVHAFTFCVFLLLVLVGTPWNSTSPSTGFVPTVLVLSIPLYFLVAQHRVYAQSWLRTLGKAVLLGVPYVVLVALGTLVAAALAFRFS